jgi:histidinol-phosphate aminotransferase
MLTKPIINKMGANRSFELESFVRDNIRVLKPYSTARQESGLKNALFLDANESPFDTGYNRYPQPVNESLKSVAAKYASPYPFEQESILTAKNVFAGNGSDEAIDLLIRIFCIPGKDNIVTLAPTYGMYKVAAAINDVAVKEYRLGSGFSLDAKDLLSTADENSKLLFLCSPNNPTGNLLERNAVMDILEKFNGIVVIDEAYIDFSGDQGYISCLNDYPNLVILRTMSKSRGLAGLRVGFAYACEKIISYMDMVKYPYNLNINSQRVAIKSFVQDGMESVKSIMDERESLAIELSKVKGVNKVYPSKANFLLVDIDNPAEKVKMLKKHGVVIRDRSKEPGCEGCVRISVGKRAQNGLLLDLLNGKIDKVFQDKMEFSRITNETSVTLTLFPGDNKVREIHSGIGFLDHMLDLFCVHSGVGMDLYVIGDLDVDQHHTIEDIAIVLGEAIAAMYKSKNKGYNRYGFALPMDESRAEVLLDLGGRFSFEWDVKFEFEFTGDFPVQMYSHFFETLASNGKFNLQMKASGKNDHHIAEALFKAFARSLRIALSNNVADYELASSKGLV